MRILLSLGLVLFNFVHLSFQPIDTNKDRPNIVLIMADDMGYECLGVNGSTVYQTPNLNRLANSGARFEHCYSQPLCTPSRVKIMTGKYNFRNYVDFEYLSPDQVTFGNLLKEAGYATCIAGKWQLNGIHSAPSWGKFEHNRWVMNDMYKLYQDGSFYNTLKDPGEDNPIFKLSNREKKLRNSFENILIEIEEESPFGINN